MILSDTTIRQRQSVHCDGTAFNPFPGEPDWAVRHEWTISGATGCKYPTVQGFVAAFFIENAGVFTISHSAIKLDGTRQTETAQVTVTPETQPAINVGTFTELVAACAQPSRTINGNDKTIVFDSTVKLAAGVRVKHVVCQAKTGWGRWINLFADNHQPHTVVRQCTFRDAAANARCFSMTNKATFIDNVLEGVNDGVVNTGTGPYGSKYLLLQDNRQAANYLIREYFGFLSGSDMCCYGNFIWNCEQHCLRVNTASKVACVLNDITNMRLPDLRQSATFHVGQWHGSWRDRFAGGRVEIGPLPSGTDKTECTRNVQILEPRYDFTAYDYQRLSIVEGVVGLLIKGGSIAVKNLSNIQINPVTSGHAPVQDVRIVGDVALTTRLHDQYVVVGHDAINVVNDFGHRTQQ